MSVEPRTGCFGIAAALLIGFVLGGGMMGMLWTARERMLEDQQKQKIARVEKALEEAAKQGEQLQMMYIENVDPWCIRGFASQGKFRSVSTIYCYGAVGLCDLAHFHEAEVIDIGRIHLVSCGPHELSHWKTLKSLIVSIEPNGLAALEGIETLPELKSLTLHVTGAVNPDLKPLSKILPGCKSLKKLYISGLAGSDLLQLKSTLQEIATEIEIEESTPIGEW